MIRYFAFLRALNVGGHTVKMSDLRAEFEALGFGHVESFIASGNVIFEVSGRSAADAAAVERKIEARLEHTLGYEVRTFLRTDAELAAIVEHVPFPDTPPGDGDTLQVAFLPVAPPAAEIETVRRLGSELELLEVVGREMYWLIHGGTLDTRITPGVLKRALGGMPMTARNMTTIRRLAAKYQLGSRSVTT